LRVKGAGLEEKGLRFRVKGSGLRLRVRVQSSRFSFQG
jgi:hypothetical protein